MPQLSASNEFHLTRFIQFAEIEGDGYDGIDIICSENPTQTLGQALLDTPDILTNRSMGDHTILDYACIVDNAELVNYVLDLGVPFNLTNRDGETPLHTAIRYRAWRSARLLVKRGHSVNVSDIYGYTPLLSAIYSAATYGTEAICFVKTLVLRGADANVQNIDKGNVWHLISGLKAAIEDLWELYEMLFEAGGSQLINSGNSGGVTPLMKAIIENNMPLISFLRKVDARVDFIDVLGENLLHLVAYRGDSLSCRLVEELEIGCIDIRTTDDYGNTPAQRYRWGAKAYPEIWLDLLAPGHNWALDPFKPYQDKPGEDTISQAKSIAFEHLLRSIRDRMLTEEIKELEAIISKIQSVDLSSARDELRKLAEGKVKAKIDHEAETFRAIELDVRMGRVELAIESIIELIEVSRDRMRVSPFDEEENIWESSDSEPRNSENSLEAGGGCVVESETSDEDGLELSLDEDGRADNIDDGWNTAEEDS
ncbi:ankyrin repeat-containing domain protein [Xylaria cf. heliscus]|nr:ankyrin repeat-containing domain protein [Xylaria cf. heliscus]